MPGSNQSVPSLEHSRRRIIATNNILEVVCHQKVGREISSPSIVRLSTGHMDNIIRHTCMVCPGCMVHMAVIPHKEIMDGLEKSANFRLERENTERKKKTDVSVSVIASQLRLGIKFLPNDDKNFDNINMFYGGLINEFAPMIRDNRISISPCCANKIHDMIDKNRAITASLMKNYCTRRQINKTITVIKKMGELQGSREELSKYTPNYLDIQKVFLENGLHVEWEWKIYNRAFWRGTLNQQEKIVQHEKWYLLKMLREIIICDYQKKVFKRIDRNEDIIRMGQEGWGLDVWPPSMWHICLDGEIIGTE